MKRVRIVGLCLLAAVALSAMAASSAYAGEYGKCTKTKEVDKQYTGNYTNRNCTSVSYTGHGKSEYEWYALGSSGFPGPVSITGSTKVATSESAFGNFTCKKSTSTGELTGPKAGTEVITYTGCEASKEKEKSEGEPGGTIKTNLLDSRLVDHGETAGGKEPAEGEVWNCLTSSEDEPYLSEYEWSRVKVREKGEACAVVTGTDQMGTKTTETFGKNTAPQDLELEYSLNEGADWEGPIGMTRVTTATVKTTAKMEVKGQDAP